METLQIESYKKKALMLLANHNARNHDSSLSVELIGKELNLSDKDVSELVNLLLSRSSGLVKKKIPKGFRTTRFYREDDDRLFYVGTSRLDTVFIYLSDKAFPILEGIQNLTENQAEAGVKNFNAPNSTPDAFDKVRIALLKRKGGNWGLIDVALYDLEQSKMAYNGGAYKASVIMLGSVLEGAMQWLLTQEDARKHIFSNKSNFKGILKDSGLYGSTTSPSSAEFHKQILQKTTFSSLSQALEQLVSGVDEYLAKSLQKYRNAVHPNKAVFAKPIYGTFGISDANTHIEGMVKVINTIIDYEFD